MYLLHCQSRKKVTAEIVLISEDELTEIMSEGRFEFDWELETRHDIYAVRITKTHEIVGLMAIQDIKEEFRIHIPLLESTKENVGAKKIYGRIAGCLIAYACNMSFNKNYEGFVSLVPKTRLIEHYQNIYGFEQFGRQLAVEASQSFHLIKKYLRNDK